MTARFGTTGDSSGAWCFSDCGIRWPPVPLISFSSASLFSSAEQVLGLESFEIVSLDNGKGHVVGIIDGNGISNPKYRNHELFGLADSLSGPLLVCGTGRLEESKDNDDDGDEEDKDQFLPVSWCKVARILSRTHHSCGWPLLESEKSRLPSMLATTEESNVLPPFVCGTSILPAAVWQSLWEADPCKKRKVGDEKQQKSKSGTSAWFFAPVLHHGKSIPLTATMVESNVEDEQVGGVCKMGAFARRERIVNPHVAYKRCAPHVETVAVTFLTIECSQQLPDTIAHFLQDGTLVRCQLNGALYGDSYGDEHDLVDFVQKRNQLWSNVQKMQ